MFKNIIAALSLAAAACVSAAPYDHHVRDVATNATAQPSGKLVFAHFMIGIVSNRQSAADYYPDMERAKAYGIDAFALNIGVDPYTDTQLGFAYQAAQDKGMKVFISFDFNWYKDTSAAGQVGSMIARYGIMPAQLKVGDKAFMSSFIGDNLDVAAMRQAAGIPVFWSPYFSPGTKANPADLDGGFNWIGWPSDGKNKAPKAGANVSVDANEAVYKKWLGNKPYMAPASPWFSTHFGGEQPAYCKNWLFPSEGGWFTRWQDLISNVKPDFVEIITWNDYGESHYVGPLDSPHTDDGGSKWVNDMPHDGFLDMAKPFIAAYKAGDDKPDKYITDDQVIYWYRPHLKSAECDSTDTCKNYPAGSMACLSEGNYFPLKPDGADTVSDEIFVVTLLKSPGTLSVTSGGKTQTFEAAAGAQQFSVPMGVGKQTFALTRNGATIFSGDSLKDISDQCICGIYNFNAYVGTLPAGKADALDADGLKGFAKGLNAQCAAQPSLGLPSIGSNATATAPGASQPTVPASASALYPYPTSNSTTAPGSMVVPVTTSTSSISVPTSSAALTTSGSDSGATSVPVATSASSSIVVSTGDTAPSSTTAASAPATSDAAGSCNAGTAAPGVSGNFLGLCDYACNHGYCPKDVCTCTGSGTSVDTAVTAAPGCPAAGLDDGYKGLCAYTCARGYCPAAACSPGCG